MNLPFEIPLPLAIQAMGALQVSILIASALVPQQLNWKEVFALLPKLHRQMYWTYGIYTAAAILALGLFSLLAADDLAGDSRLARMVAGANALFWGVRVCLQWVMAAEPFLTKWWLRAGYHLLTLLFFSFTVFYGWLALR
ncbi:hypothetical protein OJ996_13520 [Luteolibacter sp. GHJ8]|uniref:Uncharacterized protein n=1 Tax=Luteolibacter rhizosphaerae TaxID=2989719 RepID=A0ABT3G428_9BACT|nr:hypothetical protein [Luteolibacter rhizosphaerae]MCW1914601.1 hypothetical protein [Luteolibacter rhizosphaerae]